MCVVKWRELAKLNSRIWPIIDLPFERPNVLTNERTNERMNERTELQFSDIIALYVKSCHLLVLGCKLRYIEGLRRC